MTPEERARQWWEKRKGEKAGAFAFDIIKETAGLIREAQREAMMMQEKRSPLLQRAIEIHNFHYERAMQRAIEIKDFHPENNSQLDWEQEEEAYLNNIIRHIQEAQCEAVERTRKYLINQGHGRKGCCKSLEKALLELTPDKILESSK